MKTQKNKDISKGWRKVPNAADYVDLSSRIMRDLIKKGEIRYAKLPSGTILIKMEWLDQYLESREVRQSAMDHIIEDVMKHFEK